MEQAEAEDRTWGLKYRGLRVYYTPWLTFKHACAHHQTPVETGPTPFWRGPIDRTVRKMKAATYTGIGGPENLVVQEVPLPTPTKGQVLVRVAAVSLNPLDSKVRQGAVPSFILGVKVWPPRTGPHKAYITGTDVAGVVEAAPPGSAFTKGQRVAGMKGTFGDGTLAEFVLIDESGLALVPDNVNFTTAAALPVVGLAALQCVDNLKGISGAKDARVLINGGAGGVGSVAVQLAAARGLKVTATASAANADRVRALGAEAALDYAKVNYEQYAASEGGFDGIVDVVGGKTGPGAGAVKRGGSFVRLATSFDLAGMAKDYTVAAVKWLFGVGPRFVYVLTAANGKQLAELLGLVSKGTLKIQVDKVFTSLDQASAAQQYLDEGRPQGKVVVVVDPSLA